MISDFVKSKRAGKPMSNKKNDFGKMIVHLFPHSAFMSDFIKTNNEKFGKENHCFIVYGSSPVSDRELFDEPNVKIVSGLWKMEKETISVIKNAQKIIVHSFFSLSLMLFLYLYGLFGKSYILFWGAEYYQFRQTYPLLHEVSKRIKRFGMKRAIAFITLIPGEYNYLSQYICSKEKHFITRYYSKCVDYETRERSRNSPLRVLVGNSATITNCHNEALALLEHFTLDNIDIFAPLSYGDKPYGERVAAFGRRLFGDKFHPLFEYMDSTDYYNFLKSMDVAVFNNDRQQAMGNIGYLFQTGAKVFLRKDTSMWSYYVEDCGCIVFDVNELKKMDYQTIGQFSEEEKRHNCDAINRDINIRSQLWEKIFDD